MPWLETLVLASLVTMVWKSLRSLHRKVDVLMSDVQTLSDTLDAIAADVATVATEVASLEAAIAGLQASTPPEVDLSGVLAKATAIRESLEAINTTPEPTPAPTPTEPAPVLTGSDEPAPTDGGIPSA